MILKFVILIIFVNLHSSLGQFVSCSYRIFSNLYSCDLTIQNPNGLNNFASIGGTHLSGMTDNDVRRILRVAGSNTTNFPSIICEKFQSVTRFDMSGINIQAIDEYSFKNCKKLQHLYLENNNIKKVDEKAFNENIDLLVLNFPFNQLSELSENVFKSLQKLVILDIGVNKISDLPQNIFSSLKRLHSLSLPSNQIKNLRIEWFLENLNSLNLGGNLVEELPRNIFMSLKNLNRLHFYSNKFKVIHSGSFRGLSNLKTIDFDNNQIQAIDEEFIDHTGVERLDMINNFCVNQRIFDNSTTRMSMRLALQNCFKNFDDLLLGKNFT